MENGPFEDVSFLLKMVIFHCYVSLPEGIKIPINQPVSVYWNVTGGF